MTVSNSNVKFSQFGNTYLWKKNLCCNIHFQYYNASSTLLYLTDDKRVLCCCSTPRTHRQVLSFDDEVDPNNRSSPEKISHPNVFTTEIFSVFLLCRNQQFWLSTWTWVMNMASKHCERQYISVGSFHT